MKRAYVAIGSNVDAEANVRRAVASFADAGELVVVSTFYRTPPSSGEGPTFVNGVVGIEPARDDPSLLFARTRDIERILGRERRSDKDAPRTIDLDVVAWPGQRHERLPHPDIERYDFVARPLAELDGRVLTRAGRSILEVARAMAPQGMVPIPVLTRELRALVQRSRRSVHA